MFTWSVKCSSGLPVCPLVYQGDRVKSPDGRLEGNLALAKLASPGRGKNSTRLQISESLIAATNLQSKQVDPQLPASRGKRRKGLFSLPPCGGSSHR
jgi:hypothetical protein